MLTPDIYDMALTIVDRAVADTHLDRKLRATLLAADETARSETAYMLSDDSLRALICWTAARDIRAHSTVHRIETVGALEPSNAAGE
jgi:hypothetical protein